MSARRQRLLAARSNNQRAPRVVKAPEPTKPVEVVKEKAKEKPKAKAPAKKKAKKSIFKKK